MIARMTGKLIGLDVEANTVLIEAGAIAYEVMVPGYSVSDLSAMRDREITLFCLEYYESSGAMGSNLIPRIMGFPQPGDKDFFQQFIKVKGIGIRKALRALAKPLADIAYMIEEGDVKMLTTLPEIGKRTAEQVVAELKGKVEMFASQATSQVGQATRTLNDVEREALEILLQLGEKRNEAQEWIERAAANLEEVDSTDVLVQAVYRLKAGGR
jgi:Holliday junction DNA helicase RuvA